MARTPSSDSRPPRTPRVPAALAGVILSLGMFGVVLGSTVPSGLYSIYQRQMGLPDSITTIVFSFYVVGVVVALVFGGHLSDQIGRRPLVLASIALSIASSATLYLAASESVLYLGRFLSGLSVGLCTGAFTAALRETVGNRLGAVLSTALTSLGLAVGPLFSAIVAGRSADPLHTPFLIYGGVGALVLAVTLLVPETRARVARPRWAPRVGVERAIVRGFIPCALAIACAYGTNGLFQSVVPLAMPAVGTSNQLSMAGATAVMLGASAVIQVVAIRVTGPWVLGMGLLILAVGLAGTAVALGVGSAALFWFATAIAGVGQGFSFRASLYRVTELVSEERTAQTVSAYYIAGYAATVVPPLGAGFTGGSAAVPVVCGLLAAVCVATFALERRTRDAYPAPVR